MNRTDFFNEILPIQFKPNTESGPDSMRVYNNKPKDINFIKRVAREKIRINGAPIHYFPIDVSNINNISTSLNTDNILKDHTDLTLLKPISMQATWTPQEYQLDLSKWGVIMPNGSDQQIFIHVDDLEDYLKRKPIVGDIIETLLDKTRYKVADVFFGHINLWENIFCMLTLTKTTYDNYTQQLDQYDDLSTNYKETYTKLEEVLDIMTGSTTNESNASIQQEKIKTDSPTKPRKKSIDVGLDIMTMKL